MTRGEIAIWAAAFVAARAELLECAHSDEFATETAVGHADGAVHAVRAYRDRCPAGLIDDITNGKRP